MAPSAGGDGDPLDVAEAWLAEGRRIALATVVETWGSAPRPAGSHLVVDADGNFEGSVSGGCVEGAVILEAAEAMADGRPRLLGYGVADETAWQVGLSCGGRISVLVRPIGGPADEAPALLAEANAARRRRDPVGLATDVATGRMTLLAGGDIADENPAVAMFAEGRSGLCETAAARIVVASLHPTVRLIVIGAVHVTQALAPMAKLAGIDTIVVDPRTGFATTERFPAVPLHALWPEVALPAIGIDRHTALAALTHEARIDDAAIELALRHDAFYVGALGSRQTHARRLERLAARGFPSQTLARIRGPIGLDIGARSPAEIAVSILAEIIDAKATRKRRAPGIAP